MIERQTVALAPDQPYWLDVALLETAVAIAPTALYRSEFLKGFYVQEALAMGRKRATITWLPKYGYQNMGLITTSNLGIVDNGKRR